jgi:hypothetical protein
MAVVRPVALSARSANGASRDWRLWLLALLALGAVLAIVLLPRVPQPEQLMTLSDRRTILGVPNFFDVVSNAPFVAIGLWGLYVVASGGRFSVPAERWPWAVVFLSVALTGLGSAYFHLAPDGARLMWDRLPIAVGFMALLAALVAERISVRAGVRLLSPLALAGAASVLYWRWSVLDGAEDVLPYAVVQYGGAAVILLLAALYRPRYSRSGDIFAAAAFYALAKAAELLDAQIYALGGFLSGHTLKHLLAALALWWLLRMLQLRSAL